MENQRKTMSVSGSDKATVRSEDVAHFMHEYKKRRKTQMARFFGVTMFTLITCRMAMKKMTTTKAPLSTFQTNYAVPRVQAQTGTGVQEGLTSSLIVTTAMTLGTFGMGITGTCWSWDVSSFQELKQRLERRANNEPVVTNMSLDKSSQQVVDALVEQ
ncbi:SUVC02G0555 [Saccharomyces uvarum]|uniref:Altered inheritance of mitochondria protein 11 n=1 Tax=Saccharomyces uvarum TaxID=230603 RepID=A0AA35JCZ0_SACUV|nr:SUVC02G0555 [Saccharomyces uvarum]